jgi:cell division protein FtsX
MQMPFVKSALVAMAAAVAYSVLAFVYAVGSVSGWRVRQNVAIGVNAIRAILVSPVVIGIGIAVVALAFVWEFRRAS